MPNNIGGNPRGSTMGDIILTGEAFNVTLLGARLKGANLWGRPGGSNPYAEGSQLNRACLTDADRQTLATAQYVVFSYETPIAWKMADGRWFAPRHTYSDTTRQHVLTVESALSHMDVREENGNLIRY